MVFMEIILFRSICIHTKSTFLQLYEGKGHNNLSISQQISVYSKNEH